MPTPYRLLALSLATALAVGCGPGTFTDVGTVSVGFPLGSSDITAADYSITAADISPAITGSLTINAGRAEGTVADVPAGTNRLVTVRAYTGTAPNRTQVCIGSPTVNVTAGSSVPLTLLLTCTDSLGDIYVTALFDATRVPDSATATVSGTGITGSIVVPLAVGGGTLTGLIKNVPAGAGRSVTLSTSKNGTTECTGMTTVTVNPGATVTAGPVTLTCSSNPAPTTGSISINGRLNFTPRIHSVAVSQPGVLTGGTVSVNAVASDGDGDTLTYAWTLGGSASALFASPSAATSNFTATGLTAGSYTLTVTVSDGLTPSVSSSVTLVVASNQSIGFCKLQSPSTGTLSVGGSLDVYGWVYVDGAGSTGTSSAGAAAGVLAQAGYGPSNGDPSATPGAFTWSEASFNKQVDAGGLSNNNDEHKATLRPAAAGTYRYAFRYSTNAGGTWLYCDLNGNDTTPGGFDPAQQGTLTVNP